MSRSWPVSSGSANRSRRNAARPRVELDGRDLAPPPRAGRRSGARARARSRGRGARARGAASARIASSTSGSARKFCESAWRARRPAARSVARTSAGSRRGRAGRSPLGARAASGSDGRASRSRPDRSPAANRRAPAAPIIAPLSVHRAGRGTIERDAELVGLAREPGAQTPVRGDAAAEHDRAGAASRGPHGSSWSRGRRRRRPGTPRRARRRARGGERGLGVVGEPGLGARLGRRSAGRPS